MSFSEKLIRMLCKYMEEIIAKGGKNMALTYSPEQIVRKLREAEVSIGEAMTTRGSCSPD